MHNKLSPKSQFSDGGFHRTIKTQHVRPLTASKMTNYSYENTTTMKSLLSRPLNRIKSSASTKQLTHMSNFNFLMTELAPTPTQKDLIQHRIYDRFQNETLLNQNHDSLLQNIKTVDQEVVNYLNLNFFALQQQNRSNSTILDSDPNLSYSLFEALCQLDKDVLRNLFGVSQIKYSVQTDTLGQPLSQTDSPSSKFRLEYLKTTAKILNEPMAQLIRKAANVDKDLATFVEGIWKYLVVLFDVVTQWCQTRCQNYVQEEVAGIMQSYQDAKESINKLQEQIVTKVNTDRMKHAVEQNKLIKMTEKFNSAQADLMVLKRHYEEMGSLDYASGEMFNLGIRLREQHEVISALEKQEDDRQNRVYSSMTDVAQTVVQRYKDKLDTIQNYQHSLRIHQIGENLMNHICSTNPLTSAIIVSKDAPHVDINPLKILNTFMEDLIKDPKKLILSEAVAETFIQTVGFHQASHITKWLSDHSKDPQAKFYCSMFGIRFGDPVHTICVQRLCHIMQFVLKEKPLFMSVPVELNHNWIDSSIPDGTVKQRIISRLDDSLESFANLMLMILEELQTGDVITWKERVALWLKSIDEVGFVGEWHKFEKNKVPLNQVDLLDLQAIWTYVVIGRTLGQPIELLFQQIWNITLNRPQYFYQEPPQEKKQEFVSPLPTLFDQSPPRSVMKKAPAVVATSSRQGTNRSKVAKTMNVSSFNTKKR